MDPDRPSSSPSKPRFAPKAPRRKQPQPVEAKSEVASDDEAAAQALLRRVNEHLEKRGPKVEKKSAVHVAFGHGAASSTSLRTYGKPREGNDGQSKGWNLRDSAGQIVLSSPTTDITDGDGVSTLNAVVASSQKAKKEYREPWDYHRTYYPTTLPLRRPYSGNPELLDKKEFGEDAASLEYDDNAINSASELGLLEENDEVQMLFLQFPPNLPLDDRVARVSPSAKGKDVVECSISSRDESVPASSKGKERENAFMKGCSLEELPGGYMGKMLVYKSGAIKLNLGKIVYDVSPGTSHIFAQDAVAINAVNKKCCMLGEVGKRAVVTPDIDSLLLDGNIIDLS